MKCARILNASERENAPRLACPQLVHSSHMQASGLDAEPRKRSEEGTGVVLIWSPLDLRRWPRGFYTDTVPRRSYNNTSGTGPGLSNTIRHPAQREMGFYCILKEEGLGCRATAGTFQNQWAFITLPLGTKPGPSLPVSVSHTGSRFSIWHSEAKSQEVPGSNFNANHLKGRIKKTEKEIQAKQNQKNNYSK